MIRRIFLSSVLFVCLSNSQYAYSQDKDFLNRKGEILNVHLVPIDSTSRTVTYDVLLVGKRKDTISQHRMIYGRIRYPKDKSKLYPAAFLMVGIETGKNVVDMIEGYDDVIVFGMDYPFKFDMDFSGWKGFRTAMVLRQMGNETISRILLCNDWLSSLREVDTSNITMIAVSFGVFTAVPAAVLDKRIDRLVIVQGGGDLYLILKSNAERLGFSLPNWLVGWLGAIILAPLEPNYYIEKFSPRPLLIVSGESDLLFPRSSVQSLYEHAKEPKEWIEHQSSHIAPDESELILELTKLVGDKLYGKK